MKVLALFAHIDDHICFGWPLMQNGEIEKHLVVCTNDGNGILQKSCEDAGIHLISTAELPKGFYHHRAGELDMVANYLSSELEKIIEDVKPDFLFTHNPWGEYGHFDHQFVFAVAYGNVVPVLVTDITVKSLSFPAPKQGMYRSLYTKPYTEVEADYDFYSRQADIFRKAGLWTNNQYLDRPFYPPETVKLYKIEDEN